MKQVKVSKNTKFVANGSFEDLFNGLKNEFIVKRDIDSENNLLKFH